MAARKVFISYRREDARADAGRLYDRLHARYPDRVFRDVGSLEPGVDWKQAIDGVLQATDACIVVIGPRWLTVTEDDGKRRIDDPRDPVRREVARALASGIRVFPVLVGDARMPDEADLPQDLQPLANRNALELSEQDFDAGVDKLVKALERMPGWAARERPAPRRSTVAAIAAAAALLVLIAAVLYFRSPGTDEPPEGTDAQLDSAPSAAAAPDDGSPVTTSAPSTGEAAAPLPGADGSVGQISFEWSGVNATAWQVFDERKRTLLRYASAAPGRPEIVDIAPGRYLVVIDGKPEIAPIPVTVAGGRASAVAPQRVGQVTVEWTGENAVAWQLFDAARRTSLRFASAGPGRRETLDVAEGQYLVVMDKPEMAPFPVTIKPGQETTVTPGVGQLTLSWGGVNALVWQVADAGGKNIIRYESTSGGQTRTIDMGPGRYVVLFGSNPEMKPIPVAVAAGKETRVPFGRTAD